MDEKTLTTSEESKRAHFVCGANSFLGSYFIYSRSERPENFIILKERSSQTETIEALQRRLESCAESYRRQFKTEKWEGRISVVAGSGDEQSYVIDETSLTLLRQASIEYFWYFASPRGHMKPIDSIRQALKLAHSISVKRFIYLSSAFTAGRQSGLIPEQLHTLPREFFNSDEETMCRAEHEIAGFCEANKMDYRILRPSIVIGPSLTMKTDCQTTLSYLIRDLYQLQPARSNQPLSIVGAADTSFNLITIDQLLEDVSYLIENDFAGGPIYHLTSTYNLTLDDVLSTILRRMETAATPRYAVKGAARSAFEEFIDERLRVYSPYMQNSKQFERSLPRKDGVTKDELYGHVVECIRELSPERDVELERRWLQAPDGTSFCSYAIGGANLPPVVLINAIGMPVRLMAGLVRQLGGLFRILTWESRWAPSPEGIFDPQRCDLNHHLLDLTTLLDFAAVDRAHVIGWCNGAQLALKFASSFPQRARSLVLLNGTFNLPDNITRTAFEKNMRVLMPQISANRNFAELYYRMTTTARFRPNGFQPQAETAGRSSSFITCRNPALRHLTNAPFKTPELLYRYANMVKRCFDEPAVAPDTNLSIPVLVISGDEDQISHPDTSREIARRINNASLTILEGGDHHALHDDHRLPNLVLDFLLKLEADHYAQSQPAKQAEV
jgi:pimeloyl-ACP methyl ester carboxylesterase/nucleoside-diphosphate-sugar epimerase